MRCDHTLYTSIAEARNNYKKVIVTLKSIAPKNLISKIVKQVAGAGFGGPLLICLLYFTLNKKSS